MPAIMPGAITAHRGATWLPPRLIRVIVLQRSALKRLERLVDQERGPYERLEHGEHVLPEGVGPLQKNTSAPMIPRA